MLLPFWTTALQQDPLHSGSTLHPHVDLFDLLSVAVVSQNCLIRFSFIYLFLAYSQRTFSSLFQKKATKMAFRIHQREHYLLTDDLNKLIEALRKVEDQTLIQQTKKEVLPLCNQWLGEAHALTQQLRNVGE